MASGDGLDIQGVRARVSAMRRQELQECLERLGMSKTGKKDELQRKLLDMFENTHNLVSRGYTPRAMWEVTAAQRVIEDVYERMAQSGFCGRVTPSALQLPRYADPAAGARGGPVAGPPLDAYRSSTAVGKVVPGQYMVGGHGQRQANGGGAGPGPGSAAYLNGGGGALGAGAGGNGSTAGSSHLVAAVNDFIRSQMAQSLAAAAHVRTVRCLCGSSLEKGLMLQCRAAGCGVWQHANCAGVPATAATAAFYCEVCRAKRADPFWEVVESTEIMAPARLSSTGKFHQYQNVQYKERKVERHFNINAQQHSRFRSRTGDHQLQLACLQLHDTCPFRFHWPLNTALEVNGVTYRVYSRNATQKLGANGRDEPANISMLCPVGRTRLSLGCADNSAYVLVVLLVRKRSMEEVRALMAQQLSLHDAVERVREQLHADSDEDLETERTVISLRCPLLGSRMRTPARFTDVRGLACFDLQAFLDGAARTRKWQCPNSMAQASVHSLQVDTYMERILECLADQPNVTEVEVAPDARWRPAGSRDRWFDVEHDAPDVFAYEAKQALLQQHAGALKAGEGAGAAGAAGGSDDEEEEDEEEELRQAAAAFAAVNKRKRAPSPDVIEISDSDDEQPAPAPGRQDAAQAQQQARGGDGAGPSGRGQPGGGAAGGGGSRQQAAPLNLGPGASGQGDGGGGGLRVRLGPGEPGRHPGDAAGNGAGGGGGGPGGGSGRARTPPGHVAAQLQHFEALAAAAAAGGAGQAHDAAGLYALRPPAGLVPGSAAHLLLMQLGQAQGQAAEREHAADAAGAGGGGGSSLRQPAASAARSAAPIRISLAANGGVSDPPAGPGEGAPPLPPPGLPMLRPYTAPGAALAAAGTGAAGAGVWGAGGSSAAALRDPGPAHAGVSVVRPAEHHQHQPHHQHQQPAKQPQYHHQPPAGYPAHNGAAVEQPQVDYVVIDDDDDDGY